MCSLTYSSVCITAGISRSASECLVVAIGDVLVCASVAILLCQTKVNDIHYVSLLSQAHQKVVWLHITMNEVFGVDILQSVYLNRNKN